MHWIFIALATAFFFGAYNVFIKVAAGHINQIVGAVILQVIAAFVGGIVLLLLKITHTPLALSQKGIWFSVMAGVMVGLAEIASFYLFSRGVFASTGVPIIIGGSIVVATILGLVFLKETVNPIQYFAILLIVAGVVLLTAK